jgi:hypothetical protein
MNEERNKERTEGRKKTGETEAKKDIKRANDERKKKKEQQKENWKYDAVLMRRTKELYLGYWLCLSVIHLLTSK